MTQSKFAHGFQLNFLSNDAQSMANNTVIPRLRTLVSNETYQLHPIHISVNFYNVSDNVFNVGSHSNNKHRLTGNYFQRTFRCISYTNCLLQLSKTVEAAFQTPIFLVWILSIHFIDRNMITYFQRKKCLI